MGDYDQSTTILLVWIEISAGIVGSCPITNLEVILREESEPMCNTAMRILRIDGVHECLVVSV